MKASLLILFLFAALSVSAQTVYNRGDLAVINELIANNGLQWTKANLGDLNQVPADWKGVVWSDDDTDKRIVRLILQGATLTDDQDLVEGVLTGQCHLSKLTALQHLDCSLNKLTSLRISDMPHLQTLRCNDNELTTLHLSGCTNLQILSCNDNRLSSLDVSALAGLHTLYCGWNSLTSLDVSSLTQLFSLSCSNNNLSSLHVAGCISLQALSCIGNKLTSLDVSECTNLMELNCMDNQLTTLNVSACTNLGTLWCQNNRLIMLDLTALDSGLHFYGQGQTRHLTLTGNGHKYTTPIVFAHGATFDHTALTYRDGILESASNAAKTSGFVSPTGLPNTNLSGTLTLDYKND